MEISRFLRGLPRKTGELGTRERALLKESLEEGRNKKEQAGSIRS
jgi:hypothetical protein